MRLNTLWGSAGAGPPVDVSPHVSRRKRLGGKSHILLFSTENPGRKQLRTTGGGSKRGKKKRWQDEPSHSSLIKKEEEWREREPDIHSGFNRLLLEWLLCCKLTAHREGGGLGCLFRRKHRLGCLCTYTPQQAFTRRLRGSLKFIISSNTFIMNPLNDRLVSSFGRTCTAAERAASSGPYLVYLSYAG